MFTEIQNQIQRWHAQQGHTDELTQLNKLIEELGEVAKELGRNDEQALKTELGDVLIVLISLDMINEIDRDLRPFFNYKLIPCADKKAFIVNHMKHNLIQFTTTAHGIEFVKRLGYDPTECLELAWNKEQAKVSKPNLIGGFEFINRYELLLNGMIIFGDNEMVNFMPKKPYQPRELRISPMRIGNIEPNRWFIAGNTACLILGADGVTASYKAFEIKENGGFEMCLYLTSINNTVDLIH